MHAHVSVAKHRREVFTAASLNVLRELFEQVSADFGAELRSFEGERDHVHLLVTDPTKLAWPDWSIA